MGAAGPSAAGQQRCFHPLTDKGAVLPLHQLPALQWLESRQPLDVWMLMPHRVVGTEPGQGVVMYVLGWWTIPRLRATVVAYSDEMQADDRRLRVGVVLDALDTSAAMRRDARIPGPVVACGPLRGYARGATPSRRARRHSGRGAPGDLFEPLLSTLNRELLHLFVPDAREPGRWFVYADFLTPGGACEGWSHRPQTQPPCRTPCCVSSGPAAPWTRLSMPAGRRGRGGGGAPCPRSPQADGAAVVHGSPGPASDWPVGAGVRHAATPGWEPPVRGLKRRRWHRRLCLLTSAVVAKADLTGRRGRSALTYCALWRVDDGALTHLLCNEKGASQHLA